MCRLLGYLGSPISLEQVLSQPEHSLIVQSYQPKEMKSGVVNADGFGVGWYDSDRESESFTYKNTVPIWSDVNLPSLSRYVESHCLLANVRSATAGIAVDLSNCQPFQYGQILSMHNGLIKDFRHTLYRPICDRLSDAAYQWVKGSTDSEHMIALLIDELETSSTLIQALHHMLKVLTELGEKHQTPFSANFILSDGQQLVGSRYAYQLDSPSLYYLKDEPVKDHSVSNSVLIASEPLFEGNWESLPDRCLFTVHHDLTIDIQSV
ncbi:MAG: ergothioneine biosynthesis protein EgtC [Myxacorys californica WJT36-NPBG1]|jgi:glutamine amidotransferase|nr:ergothioneine biosynthesis protein EgtC [Myxacorys californica WJT36-NPBG1]